MYRKRGVQAARLPLEPGGTGSKLSYRSQHVQRSGERDRAGSSHTCLRRIAAGRKLGLFSCSIPPWFVISHNMPMINTTSNWLCSGAFHSPPVPSLRIQWALVTILSPHAPRPSPLAPHPTIAGFRRRCHGPSWARHSPPGGSQHATTCYVFRSRQKFGELLFGASSYSVGGYVDFSLEARGTQF
jgi:hypothetical protein